MLGIAAAILLNSMRPGDRRPNALGILISSINRPSLMYGRIRRRAALIRPCQAASRDNRRNGRISSKWHASASA